MSDLELQYRSVLERLKLVASSFEEQQKLLPDFADVPDDILGEFDNAFLLLPQLIEDNRFTHPVIASFLRLNNRIQWCERNVDLDDFGNDEWNKVREMAKETLYLITHTS